MDPLISGRNFRLLGAESRRAAQQEEQKRSSRFKLLKTHQLHDMTKGPRTLKVLFLSWHCLFSFYVFFFSPFAENALDVAEQQTLEKSKSENKSGTTQRKERQWKDNAASAEMQFWRRGEKQRVTHTQKKHLKKRYWKKEQIYYLMTK